MIIGKYNQAKTVTFDLVAPDGVDLIINASFASGDVVIMKDEGAEANTTNLPTDEGTGYSLVLTATEMSAARIRIYIIDQTGTKIWLDISIGIETYGNASAEHAFDLDTANVTLAAVTHAGAVIPTVSVLTSHTPQSGDNFARLGAPAGASVSADVAAVKTDSATILIDTADIQPKIGTPVTDVSADIVAIQSDTNDIQTRLPAALAGGLMSSDVTAISTDTVAADNLESQFDTTGLTGDTFPSTQSQLSNIANVGSAVHKSADSYTLTIGTQSANTVADTEALNAVRHTHTDTAGAIDYYYEFSIGSGIPASIQITGYVNGGNDDIGIYGYDWVTSAWVQIGTFFGKNNSNNEVNSYDLFVDMVGTGANEGLVRTRFYTASGLTSATVAVDQIFVAFNQGVEGYDNAAVWYDSDAANTNTVVGIDGVSRNPVSTIAAVNTLLASTNLHRVNVSPGSSITLAAAQVDQIFKGNDWTLALGGQDISGSYFEGATVSGIGTSPTGEVRFSGCDIQTISIGAAHLHQCGFESGTTTLTAAGNYIFNQCYSQIAGSGVPIIDFGAALGNTNLNIADYSNGIQIDNLNATGADNFSISGHGQIIYGASSSGAVNQRGMWKVTNTGGVTITTDDNTTNLNSVLIDTDELQADWTNGGRLDLLLDQLITQVDTAASEPGQTAPPVSAKMALKIDYLYKWMRNRSTSTATTINMYADDATTVDQKSSHSDDGTTYDRGEIATGP